MEDQINEGLCDIMHRIWAFSGKSLFTSITFILSIKMEKINFNGLAKKIYIFQKLS